jgi:hypothetical protein
VRRPQPQSKRLTLAATSERNEMARVLTFAPTAKHARQLALRIDPCTITSTLFIDG